jgi:hypothetical protein
MAIAKHTFVNPIADDPTFTGTKPSDWNADHPVTLGADENFLTDAEYQFLYGQIPSHVRVMTSPFDITTDTGTPAGVPDYLCLLQMPSVDGAIIEFHEASYIATPHDTIRILGSVNNTLIKFADGASANIATVDLANEATIIATANDGITRMYLALDTNITYFYVGFNASNYIELKYDPLNSAFVFYRQDFLNWMGGMLAVSKIDPTGAAAYFGFITEAPIDGTEYVRKDGAWVASTGGGGIPDAPNDGNYYVRRNNAWEILNIGV